MREWAEHTAGRILALKPRRVLEIGCGTGMLLFRIAPHCEHYHAVDFSASAIRFVDDGSGAARPGQCDPTAGGGPRARLRWSPRAFDLIVLNSVVQYFPSADYLVEVYEQDRSPGERQAERSSSVTSVACPFSEAFHTSVVLEQAPASLPAAEMRHRVRQRLERDHELVLDPMFFRVLPQQLPRRLAAWTCS